jgi:hypothetical protein
MRIFLRTLLIFSIPLIIVVGIYVWLDPFKVLRTYKSYVSEYVMLNRGYISTEVFLKNNQTYHYDSFIFGSSRSIAYKCTEWKKYLPADCSVFSYGNWNESIEGILRKVQLIDLSGNKIRNVIIVIDPDKTFRKENTTLAYDHYLISGKSRGQFQMTCFSQWLRDYKLILASIDYRFNRKQRSYMNKFVGMKPDDLDPVTNDWYPNSEADILKDSVAYYSNGADKFYKRPDTETESEYQISTNDSVMLQTISSVFKKHNAKAAIIISPLYDQLKFNRKDIRILGTVFGNDNIFDFSGKNEITDNMYNYCDDALHYRSRTGNRILSFICSPPQITKK